MPATDVILKAIRSKEPQTFSQFLNRLSDRPRTPVERRNA